MLQYGQRYSRRGALNGVGHVVDTSESHPWGAAKHIHIVWPRLKPRQRGGGEPDVQSACNLTATAVQSRALPLLVPTRRVTQQAATKVFPVTCVWHLLLAVIMLGVARHDFDEVVLVDLARPRVIGLGDHLPQLLVRDVLPYLRRDAL